MRSISMRLAEMEKVKINIGYVGENEHTTVLIDCKKAFDEYPEAVASLTVRPPRGGEYPAVVVRNGNVVEWTVTDSDLIYAGNGEIQLTFTVGEVIVKTAIGTTVINRSLMRPGDIPTPIQNWIEQANQKIAAAEEATREAKAAAEHQPIIDDNGNWNTWDDDEGAYVDTGIKAQGEDGAPGRDGQDGQDGAPGQDGTDATPDLITVPYSQLTFPVAAGTQCYHDGKLYEANQAIQSSEQWTAAHWTETTVEEQLSTVKSDLQSMPDMKNSSANNIDLDISDNDGNVIMRLSDGGVKTKKFDSERASESLIGDGISDLDIADPDGNVLLRLKKGHIYTKNFTSETVESRTTFISVKTEGGDFTTLRGALDYINAKGDADPVEHPYVINIYPGTYNIMSDYTQEEIETADTSDYHDGFVGAFIPNGVSLIGVGDRDSIILYGYLDTSTYNQRTRRNISTLNTQGNCALENLTVIAVNIRYCVHDDFIYSGEGQYNRIVRNCRFIGKNLAHEPACTWGGGMSGKGMNSLFENVDFGTDFGSHGTSNMWSTRTVMKNCRGRKVRLAERDKTNHHYVILEGCDFEMISLMDSYAQHTQNIFIEATGCEKTYISCYENDIIITGAITKTPATSLPIGTLVRRKTTAGNGYEATSDPVTADGVVVANDEYYSYIQRGGFINTRILGMSGFSLGDYITLDGNNSLTQGGTAQNAVGVISFISQDSDATDQGMGFVKLLIGGMQ